MSFEYIKEYYNVPAEIGRRVTVNGRPGIIVEDKGNYIGVNFDHEKVTVVRSCHPEWEVVYGGIGKPRKMSPGQKRYQEYLRSEYEDGFAAWLGIRGFIS